MADIYALIACIQAEIDICVDIKVELSADVQAQIFAELQPVRRSFRSPHDMTLPPFELQLI